MMAGITAASLGLVYLLTSRALRTAVEGSTGADAGILILRDFGEVFLIASLIAIPLAAIAVTVLASAFTRPLGLLRAASLARARGDSSVPPFRSGIHEFQTVAAVVERTADEMGDRISALTEERDQIAALVQFVSEGLLQVGPDARVVHANPAARRLLGTPDQVVGRPVTSLVRHADLRALLERAVNGESIGATEVALDDRRILVGARPIAFATGADPAERAGTIIALNDLTEVRRLEGVRRDFVANVSHELKTPLTSIRGYVETLMTDELPDEMKNQFLLVIQKNAERLQGIVDDLLDLSRLESGGWRPQMQHVDALRAAEEAWLGSLERATAKRIAFHSSGDTATVLADPGGLRQVFSNLYDNAIRHTPGGGRITVHVARVPAAQTPAPATTPVDGSLLASAAPDGVTPPHRNGGSPEPRRWVLIEVQDTGSGIPSDALPRIFERFYRVDPARSRAEGGTGLGLSIVRHLMERMGGVVSAESDLGKGTTIRLHLQAP
jgi:signal transduction histidine kinase